MAGNTKQKFYAVKEGKVPGIYSTWKECEENTKGFSGAIFKSFPTLEEAEAFMGGTGNSTVSDDTVDNKGNSVDLPAVYAFTDGSYNKDTKVYGFGGFLHYSETEPDIKIHGHNNDPDEAVSRNVSGEVHGAVAAMQKAVELGLSELTIFYDYEGVECWPTGKWKTNKPISQYYVSEYNKIKDRLKVNFIHVKAHTGIPGNEEADRIAKEEVGLEK